jgi:16S rRNA (guanine527-N7)-methyltransferase
VAPELRVTLVEARQRKCAFLKEVARQCGFTDVEVVAERFEDWVGSLTEKPGIITTRAVNVTADVFHTIRVALAPAGTVVFLTTAALASAIQAQEPFWKWSAVSPAGMSNDNVILVGRQHIVIK